jgi:hypothetical protein
MLVAQTTPLIETSSPIAARVTARATTGRVEVLPQMEVEGNSW